MSHTAENGPSTLVRFVAVVAFLLWAWASHLPYPPGSDFMFKVGYAASYAWNALTHLFT